MRLKDNKNNQFFWGGITKSGCARWSFQALREAHEEREASQEEAEEEEEDRPANSTRSKGKKPMRNVPVRGHIPLGATITPINK